MTTTYAWPEILAASEKTQWRVEDLIDPTTEFDFRLPFLPEALARTRPLAFLDAQDRLLLNQIRAHGYLFMFGLVEEFILPFVLDHARPELGGDDHRTRALLAFASEEAKHIHLFKEFRAAFLRGFGTPCDVIGPPEAVAQAVLAHDPLSVALVILQIEWMTQRHWLECVRDDQTIDARFKSLLKHHWMEEAQHAKVDANLVAALAAPRDATARTAALDGYLAIGEFVDQGLAQQTRFDLAAFEQARGRELTAAQREEFVAVQHQAMRWTFLGSGMTHPKFLQSLADLGAEHRQRIERIAPAFC